MGTGIGMSINHWNNDKLLPFVWYSANCSHGARTASEAPPNGVEDGLGIAGLISWIPIVRSGCLL